MRRPRPVRLLLAVLLGAGAGLAGPAALPGPAFADEVHPVPADGVFEVDGHGWGHGRGLSQWGAQGAATHGVSADTIVSTYYPGTVAVGVPDRPVRVWLQEDEGADLQVAAAPGLVATDLQTGAALALPAGYGRWRAVVDGAGLHLQGLAGATWVPVALGGTGAVNGPVRFSGSPVHRVWFPDGSSRDYRGVVDAVRTSTYQQKTVVTLSLEQYLLGVVPRESPSSFHPEALKAQAIAARSYTMYKLNHAAAGPYDICDTTACQVFGGTTYYPAAGPAVPQEMPSTNGAVAATAGRVQTWAGAPILAEFSSSNGGWSTAGGVPYLVARPDPWDGLAGASVHAWTARLTAADVQRAFPAVGRLLRVRVTGRDGNGDWGGRVATVTLEGVDGAGRPTSVRTTGRDVYLTRVWPAVADGLRSNWWQLRESTASNPVGSLDAVSRVPGGVRVAGWAIDPDDLAAPLAVHVYAGATFLGALTARDGRADVSAAFPGAGPEHGFGAVLRVPPGVQRVCAYAINIGAGTANPPVGCATLAVTDLPVGSVDLAQRVPGGVRVAGWALDQDSAGAVAVHAYADGAFVRAVAADRARPDVGSAFPGYGGGHGYDVVLPLDAGVHPVCLYGINLGEGAGNPPLGCLTVGVASLPFGSLDLVSAGAGRVRVAGWAVDPDTAGPVDVHVYAGSRFLGVVHAGQPRGDVGALLPGYGAGHGFDGSLSVPSGAGAVCAWAINEGPGAGNPLLGCRPA